MPKSEETVNGLVNQNLTSISFAVENVTTTSEVAALAKKTADNAEALYADGAVTQSDVNDARLGAFAAGVEATRAVLDLETARIGLAYSIGELSSYIKTDEMEPAILSDAEADRARATLDALP